MILLRAQKDKSKNLAIALKNSLIDVIDFYLFKNIFK